MAKTRSPSYPAIGLKDALERVRLVYNKDYQNKLPKQVVAEHMGYKGLSGASLPVLAALRKYGLLEGRGNDTQVSDLALAIIAHQPGAPERIEAIKMAARSPELFAELDDKFQEGKASDVAIRSYLLTQKFIPVAADATIRAYRETKKLVEEESQGYVSLESPEPEPEKMATSQAGAATQRQVHSLPSAIFPSGATVTAVKTNENAVRVSWAGDTLEVFGVLVDGEGVDRLIKALQANKPLLPEKKEPSADHDGTILQIK